MKAPNNSMQRTALRAVADAERWADESRWMMPKLPYITMGFASQDACFRTTLSYIERDEEATRTSTELDEALALVESWATCAAGCHGGDHVLEKFATRAVGQAVAAIRLTFSGHYDESLVLSRAIGESANLFLLFARNPDALPNWKGAAEKERRSKYSAVAVRRRLEELGDSPWMDHGTYSELSGRVVHLAPDSAPQVYDGLIRPNVGSYFQENGLRRGLFELAVQFAGVMVALSEMTIVEKGVRHNIAASARKLLFSVPGVQESNDAQQHDEPDEGSASLRLRRLS